MEDKKEITLEQIKEALEEAWKDYSLKEELLTDNLIHVYANGESWDIIMNKDAYEAEMDSAIREVVLDKDKLESYYDASEN